MLNWSRNGALILMDLESPFWRFLYDDLDVFLVRFYISFGQKAIVHHPRQWTLREPKGMVCFSIFIRNLWCFVYVLSDFDLLLWVCSVLELACWDLLKLYEYDSDTMTPIFEWMPFVVTWSFCVISVNACHDFCETWLVLDIYDSLQWWTRVTCENCHVLYSNLCTYMLQEIPLCFAL